MADDYFIGVHARELERLRDQHLAWAPETRQLWRHAGFREGQHIVDLGSGPGFATLDLAEIVGSSGRVAALDKASPYLDFLLRETRRRALENLYVIEADITAVKALPGDFDGAFCRFFLAFLIRDLDAVLKCVHRSLKPGGIFAAMEYLTLESATASPPVRGFDAHTQAWIRYYRDHGGDTTIGSCLPARLRDAGFAVEHVGCVGGTAQPSHRWWRWWGRLMEDFGEKLAAEGLMSSTDLAHLLADWTALPDEPHASMHTPLLVQIVARKATG